MSLPIHGLGVAVPPHTMTQAEALELAEGVLEMPDGGERALRAVYRRAGVERRHTCVPYQTGYAWAEMPREEREGQPPQRRGASTRVRMEMYEEFAPPLAEQAAAEALEQAKLRPSDVTHLVIASCTGFAAPGVDNHLITKLGLPAEIERVSVGFMGCHAAINALRTTEGLAAVDPRRRVLMVAVELCSLHYYFAGGSPDKLVSNALFADGAAALVAGGESAAPATNAAAPRLLATGSCLLPESTEAMSWRVGDYGFEMTLSAAVPERIAQSLRGWLTGWLERYGVSLDGVANWAIHPGGPRIVGAVAEALGLPASATDASRAVLAEYGNMSSPTVLFVLRRLQQSGATGPTVLLAFGPGLTAEAALVHL